MQIDYTRYIQLVADSARYHALRAQQLPEIWLALVIILFLTCAVVALVLLLRAEEKENRELHSVIDGMHGMTEKEADRRVIFEAHGGAE